MSSQSVTYNRDRDQKRQARAMMMRARPMLSRVLGIAFSALLGSAFALRFSPVRERLFGIWPGSRSFINKYYPQDLGINRRISGAVSNLRSKKSATSAETSRSRYGEHLPGEAK